MMPKLRLQEIGFKGSTYGTVYTSAPANCQIHKQPGIRLEKATLPTLATLAADILGEPQPYLRPHEQSNLAKWVIRYGRHQFGQPFLRATARALIWRAP